MMNKEVSIVNRDKNMRQLRAVATNFTTREDSENNPHIEGYFAVFNSVYEIMPGVMTESIAPFAFDGAENEDVRALTNHDTTLVLGRTTAGTLKLRQDDHGLWGDILVNPKDQDAVNTWERVKRGDVSQCSIGFDIIDEEAEYREDGSAHWTIKKVKLYEVTVCTFPAYEETNVQARSADLAAHKKRELESWKKKMKEELRNGTEGSASEEED